MFHRSGRARVVYIVAFRARQVSGKIEMDSRDVVRALQ